MEATVDLNKYEGFILWAVPQKAPEQSQRMDVPVAPHSISSPRWCDLFNLTILPWCLTQWSATVAISCYLFAKIFHSMFPYMFPTCSELVFSSPQSKATHSPS